jgi:biopolymer transport protein ExbD
MKTFLKRSIHPSYIPESIDIDVTPIMNMFFILIPFLVSMAVFTHLAVLHFSLPPNAGSALASPEIQPKLKLTVIIAEEYLAVTRGDRMLDSLAMINSDYDLTALAERLASHRTGGQGHPGNGV